MCDLCLRVCVSEEWMGSHMALLCSYFVTAVGLGLALTLLNSRLRKIPVTSFQDTEREIRE